MGATFEHGARGRSAVRWTAAAERVSAWAITIGGLGTIAAVLGVFVFLAWVAAPLLMPGRVRLVSSAPAVGDAVVRVGLDPWGVAGWALGRDGTLRAFRLEDGAVFDERTWVAGDSVTACAFADDGTVAVGLRDGTVRVGRIAFAGDFPDTTSIDASRRRQLRPGAPRRYRHALLERLSDGSIRRHRLVATLGAPPTPPTGHAVVGLDVARDGASLAVLDDAQTLRVAQVRTYENLLTGEVERELRGGAVSLAGIEGAGQNGVRVQLAPSGTWVLLWSLDGTVLGVDTRDLASPRVVGRVRVDTGGATLSVVEPLLGHQTMLLGRDDGSVCAAFRFAAPGASADTLCVAEPRCFAGPARVTAIARSTRSRLLAVGYADGSVRVFHATSGARVAALRVAPGPVRALAISPRDDGLLVLADGRLHHVTLRAGHPDATIASMFRPVWYEGYGRPAHAWQSSSGTDDFEPKFGMWPLVFGTLKATFYSMIFAVPLALLAAVFTSEFLPRTMRPGVKTLVEAMASLPSVVLGFVAALVVAPFVQRSLPAVLSTMLTLPAVVVGGACAWQMLPERVTMRAAHLRVAVLAALLVPGVGLGVALAPLLERACFAGDVMAWLDGRTGSGWTGWAYLLTPLGVAVAALVLSRAFGERLRAMAARAPRARVARLDLARAVVTLAAGVGIAVAAAGLLGALGLDPRRDGLVMGTYVQRNALVVGFVMGFAVIPIVYTLAEDALSAVPDSLRAASLGAGATPWQTAGRVVVPTAMSGLFSAVMVGLGRAVGETMIVLMAAGNTPVLEMNVFNGFRTLSANIAVELPEAVRNSTHYRTLFLSALLLFAMTFVVNTVAEVVRLRYRRRSARL